MSEKIARVQILVEEWKLLAGYVDRGFYSIESQSVQIVLLIAAGLGVFHGELKIPGFAWLFISPAIFALLLRVKSQATFTYFQSSRIIEIEDAINRLLETDDVGRIFYYAHRVGELAPKLGVRYAYPVWLAFLDLIGILLTGFCAYRGSLHIDCEWHLPKIAGAWSIVFVFLLIWYTVVAVTVSKRFKDSLESEGKPSGFESEDNGVSNTSQKN